MAGLEETKIRTTVFGVRPGCDNFSGRNSLNYEIDLPKHRSGHSHSESEWPPCLHIFIEHLPVSLRASTKQTSRRRKERRFFRHLILNGYIFNFYCTFLYVPALCTPHRIFTMDGIIQAAKSLDTLQSFMWMLLSKIQCGCSERQMCLLRRPLYHTGMVINFLLWSPMNSR